MSVFVKSIFAKGSSTFFKVGQFETLYACAGAREVILDVVPHIDSTLFIKSFRQFVSRQGCPSVMILDNGRNFVKRTSRVCEWVRC